MACHPPGLRWVVKKIAPPKGHWKASAVVAGKIGKIKWFFQRATPITFKNILNIMKYNGNLWALPANFCQNSESL